MKSQLFGIGWLLATFWTGCAASDVPWTPPEALVGTWEGKSQFYVPFFEKGASQGEHTDEPVVIRIHIASDGSVDGQVGTARLVGCKIKRNRGWLSRMLNLFWTDYVIYGGWLEGPVFSTDRETKRSFAFPFSEEGGTIGGGLQVLQKGRVPFPIFPHLGRLTKQPAANTPKATR